MMTWMSWNVTSEEGTKKNTKDEKNTNDTIHF